MNTMKSIFVLAALAATTFSLPEQAYAALEVDITQGQIKPTPIAVTNFVSTSGDKLGQEIAEVIANDLESSGLFILINPKGFNQSPASILSQGPNFADWRMLSAQCLLTGSVEVSGGQIRVQFRLFDIVKGTELSSGELPMDEKKWRRLSHIIADQVYARITGEDGYFNTQIAFIEEHGPRGRHRAYRLAIMDYDGANTRYLTDGKKRVLSSRICPNNNNIAYLSYNKDQIDPQVHVYNLATGENKLLAKFPGVEMSQSPRFSPDGGEIVYCLQNDKNSTIHIKNLSSGQTKQLTTTEHLSYDTSPCFSPDGQHIVFASDRGGSSDRLGSNQLYVMNRDGSNVNRITSSLDGARHTQPVWSPRGDLIACTRQFRGQFQIRVMKPDGTEARSVHVDGGVIESPTWSPNGRVIMFTKETLGKRGSSKLYAVDLTGRGLHQVKTPREASDASWSNLLDKVKAE